ncbi:MAG: Long-chain-fatty-acid--CoA/3-oxocholest-4-en-26-oate--CoA ligase, partial [Microbacterium sp.]|nr:Long-chain-fatty-acid--CoA/3-oxocholest-4-en-26-oate--CoA ligase [Microbacterium sp.]
MTRIHYSDLWRGIAQADPERPAIATEDRIRTYGEFSAEAGALARHLSLRDNGLVAGDAAALLLYNRAEYLTFFWACLSLGVAPVAINYRYRAGEVRALLEDCDAKALIAPTSLGPTVKDAVAGLEPPLAIVSVDDDGGPPIPGAVPYTEVVAGGGDV